MNDQLRQLRDFFVSLKLTVVLLVLGMLLVFVATLDQVNLGIWAVQEKYFRSFFVLWHVGDIPIPVFPGGYFIGGLLLINLVAAHLYRFKRGWKKVGIELTHIGLILLLVGELLSGLWQEDYSMRLEQGQPKNYSDSYHDTELAIVDTTNPQYDEVVVFPEHVLRPGEILQQPKLPFQVVTRVYYPNSDLSRRAPADDVHGGTAARSEPPNLANQGMGLRINATPRPMTYKQNERNVPTAYVELRGAEGSIGTWLVSSHPAMTPQSIQYAGRTFTIALRPTRAYKPFTLTLLKFSHDRYAGTEIPKNFSSRIRLQAPSTGDDREVLIYMNNPLRYEGLTFYQASFEPDNPNVTILQVVRNPSWLLPYIACTVMTLGLLVQFGIHLAGFVSRRSAPRPSLA